MWDFAVCNSMEERMFRNSNREKVPFEKLDEFRKGNKTLLEIVLKDRGNFDWFIEVVCWKVRVDLNDDKVHHYCQIDMVNVFQFGVYGYECGKEGGTRVRLSWMKKDVIRFELSAPWSRVVRRLGVKGSVGVGLRHDAAVI